MTRFGWREEGYLVCPQCGQDDLGSLEIDGIEMARCFRCGRSWNRNDLVKGPVRRAERCEVF